VTPTASYNGNNQVTWTTVNSAVNGFQYDASGDVLADNLNRYLYDGEGRICAVANTPVPGMTTMTGYIYDAEGTRVAKGSITAWSCNPSVNGFQTIYDYVVGLTGEQVAEMGVDANGSIVPQHNNVWWAGKLLATYDKDSLHFYLNDWLGTRRAQTDASGVTEQTCQSLPFGDQLGCTNSIQYPTEHHFTGKERDYESGNDYFEARYYSSAMGRFMSPDWSAKVMPVPYAVLGDPQSLNLYAYVRNNPLSRFDADGHVVALTCEQGSTTCPQDKSAEFSRLAADASKTDKNGMKESSLFKETTDKNGNTTMTLDKDAASKWVGGHSAGFNLLTGAIDAKQTISVQLSADDRPYTGIPDARGNMTVSLPRNESALDRIAPLKGLNGQSIPNPFQIIAGHEVLGHAYASDILGLTKGMNYQQEEIWVRQNIENTLRQEQGIPLRDPNSN
jgi:RHS repeat-associated protein